MKSCPSYVWELRNLVLRRLAPAGIGGAFLLAACAADQAPPGAGGSSGSTTATSTSATTGQGVSTSTTSSGTTGGSGGSGPTGPCAETAGPDDLISDFETGSADVAKVGGRSGSWFLFNDGSGTQTPIKTPNVAIAAESGGACESQYALHTTAMGFTVWGAGIGVTLTPSASDAGSKASYDASGYSGIAFWAKAAAPTAVHLSMPDSNTAVEGGVCTDTTDKASPTRCGDYFGSDVQVGTTWQPYALTFATTAQSTWGLLVPTGLDKVHVFAFHAQVKGTAVAPASFELWLDNVRFVK